MNVNPYITTDYENISDRTLGENKPNSNLIKANFRKAQMNVNSLITKDYRKKDDFAVQKNKANSNPISDYPCVFESAEYNLVLRDGNVMHSMPNGRDFNGDITKWQKHRKQTR